MTATEGLAFAGLVLSLFLGYLGYRTAKDARIDAREQAAEGRKAEAEKDRAARLFDARRSVYVDVMDYAFRIETFADRTDPIITFGNDPPPPPFPPEEEQRRQSAAIAAFGSPAIRAKLVEFKKAASEFQASVFLLHSFRQTHGEHSNEQLQQWQVVEQKRQALKALVLDIIELVNEELRF
jgi:hypothetical protein